jgi:peptidoglycan/xylan/chitin deacetylase (PgdA/CDA1 family)
MYKHTAIPHGLMFHHFHGEGYHPSQGSISADDFRALLRFVGTERILPADVWQDRAVNGSLDPGAICLTFDDSLRCQFDIAFPVLQEMGLSAFWFIHTAGLEGMLDRTELYRVFRHQYFSSINEFYEAFEARLAQTALSAEVEAKLKTFNADEYLAEFPFYTPGDRRFHFIRDRILGRERYFAQMDAMIDVSEMDVAAQSKKIWLTSNQVSEVSNAGHVIGLHSHTHPTQLEALSRSEQAWEYTKNNETLTAILGTPRRSMSHPCNSYDANTLDVLDELGVEIGFRANMATPPAPTRFEYPREDHANIIRMMAIN